MSAAQKAAQANFKKAIAYRKKTGCTLKQAFAHVKGGKVSGLDKVVKKGNKTTVLYTKKAKKKAAPKKKASQGVLFGTKKKKAAPKKAVVRNYGSHKDTASHNVKISVMSGVNNKINDLKNLSLKLKEAQILYKKEKDSLKELAVLMLELYPQLLSTTYL